MDNEYYIKYVKTNSFGSVTLQQVLKTTVEMGLNKTLLKSLIITIVFHKFTITATATHNSNRDCSLSDDEVIVVIVCNDTWNIGAQVDAILEPIIDFEPMTSLELNAIKFPNGRVTANWYDGHIDIYSLKIELDNVTVIEQNAFDTKAFRTISILVLVFKTLTILEAGIFNNFHSLDLADFKVAKNGLYVINPNSNIFQPIHKTIRFISLPYYTGRHFNNLFGGIRLSRVLKIVVSHCFRYRRTLAAENFTGLTIINDLELNNCGIEVIREHAFDFVGETLAKLVLSNNRIKFLDFERISVFVQSRPRLVMMDQRKQLYIYNNRIECTCDYYEMRNLTMISFGYSLFQDKRLTCTPLKQNHRSHRVCDNLQVLHVDKLFLNHPTISIYTFPNIQIKFNATADILTVKQSKVRPYRLWIKSVHQPVNIGGNQCSNKAINYDSENCLVLSNMIANINVQEYFQESELVMFCVMYFSYQSPVLPLHCATVHKSSTKIRSLTRCINYSIASVIGIVLGLVAFFLKENFCNKRNSLDIGQNQSDNYSHYEFFVGFSRVSKTSVKETYVERTYASIKEDTYIEVLT